jgi:ACS family glucarate transporter-like MFS transporter
MTPAQPPSADDQVPSKARLHVVALVCTLALILYLDRVVMGQAVGPIQEEFGLDNTQMSYVLNAFVLAYGIFEIPTGRLGDRFGSRQVLARVVLWWSAFTMLTAACTGLWSLIAVRFLFGAGEAGAFPNVARIIGRWFPAAERGRVQGLLLASGMLGSVLAPILAGTLTSRFGWRSGFLVFGVAGLAWGAWFLTWFRDDPSRHPSVNLAERALLAHAAPAAEGAPHAAMPWSAAAANRNVWLLGMIAFCGSFCTYLYLGWFPKYLQAGRGLTLVEAGWGSSLALTGSVAGSLVGGAVADRLARAPRRQRLRRIAFCCTGASAAVLLLAGTACTNPWAAIALMGGSCFFSTLHIPAWWNCVREISGRHQGAIFGLLNMCGMPGAILSQYLFGAMADWRGRMGHTGHDQWGAAFGVYCVALLVMAAAWLVIDTDRTVNGSGPPSA